MELWIVLFKLYPFSSEKTVISVHDSEELAIKAAKSFYANALQQERELELEKLIGEWGETTGYINKEDTVLITMKQLNQNW